MKLYVTDLDGKEHDVEGTPNWTVMEIIRDADLPMRAECGGSMACATCHVYIDPDWMAKTGPAGDEERDTLDGGFEIEPNSRLACQIVMKPELDGLKLTLTHDCAD
jgi:2Fe-2S ferredoxin